MKKLTFLLLIVFLSILTYVIATPTIDLDAPADGTYQLNDTVIFNCTATPTASQEALVNATGEEHTFNFTREFMKWNGSEFIDAWNGSEYVDLYYNRTAINSWNLSNISLWHNATGTWHLNQTTTITGHTFNDTVSLGWQVTGIPDHTVVNWACNVGESNETGGSNHSLSSNKTFYVEYPPNAVLTLPADDYYSSSEVVTLNFTVTDNYINDDKAICKFYTNSTLGWGVVKDYLINDTTNNWQFTYQFPDDTTTKWSIYCYESTNELNIYGLSVTNRTLTVDTTVPVIVWNVSNAYDADGTFNFGYTATDTNLEQCVFYLNLSVAIPTEIIETNTSVSSDVYDTFNTTSIAAGNWSYYVSCNDTATNWGNSTIQWLHVNSTYPADPALSNLTSGCSDMIFNVTNSVDYTNATLDWSSDTDVLTSSIIKTSFLKEHLFNISNLNSGQTYHYNITFCTRAGLCNATGQGYFRFPYKLCTGWTLYGIWNSSITMETVGTNSTAEYVYWWNSSEQSWKYWSSGVSTSAAHVLNFGDVVHLYRSTGTTWGGSSDYTVDYRYVGLQQPYQVNLTTGDNWVALYRNRTMGQLAVDFMNATNNWSFGYKSTQGINTLTFNISDFSVFNNSAHEYTVPYIYNSSWNNNTHVGNLTDFEVMWLWTDLNLTWNGSSIINNFTRS